MTSVEASGRNKTTTPGMSVTNIKDKRTKSTNQVFYLNQINSRARNPRSKSPKTQRDPFR